MLLVNLLDASFNVVVGTGQHQCAIAGAIKANTRKLIKNNFKVELKSGSFF